MDPSSIKEYRKKRITSASVDRGIYDQVTAFAEKGGMKKDKALDYLLSLGLELSKGTHLAGAPRRRKA